MYSRKAKIAAVSAVIITLSATSGLAQTSKGSISGVAKDSTGATVPDTTITIKGESTGETRTLTTKSDGTYRIDALSPERYTITGEHAGFSIFKAQHVVVPPSVVTTYNVTLAVGQTNETVTVEANALTLDTDNGQLSGTINANAIVNLPVFSENPFELTSTIPGVQPVASSAQLSNGINVQVNGARARSNNFLLDSQEINDIGIGGQAFQPNIQDLYEAVTAITSSASAEYGRAGGGVFNLVTKSGTNTYHGTVYDRYTGSGINAVPNPLRGTGQRNPRFDQHQIGATLGGYIIKDKLFAYGGTQFSRLYGNEQINPVRLPDAAGIATLNGLTDPTAKAQVALLNQYTTNNFYVAKYAQVTNQPTTKVNIGTQPGCATAPCFVEEALFQRPPAAQQQPDTQWSYRVDFKPHEPDTFYFRYLHDRGSLTPDFFANARGGALGLDTYQGGPSELGAGSWTHVFTPNVINELRASESRIAFLFAPTATTLANPAYALPTLNIAGFPTLGPIQNFPQGRAQDLYQLQDTFSYNRGRQSIRAGFDIGHQLEKDTIALNFKGTASFTSGSTGITPLGNFLRDQLGPGGTISRTNGSTRTDPHVWRTGVFVQDDVKFNPQLTVNLGLRYDYTGNPENSLKYPGIDLNNPYQPITTVVRVKNDKNNISPRLGFAYSPNQGGYFGSGKTVIRGGFGIFYDNYFSNFVTNAAQAAPNVIAGLLQQTKGTGVTNAIATLQSFNPTTISNRSSQTGVASNLVNPQTYQYNLGIEQDVKGAILAVRYVGNRAEHLFATDSLNYFVNGARLNSSRGNIVVRDNSASSNYNGLEVDASKQVGSQLNVQATYSFSKDLDNGSEIFALGDTSTSFSNNLASRAGNYGPSLFDHRHYVSVSYVWSPKGFHAGNKFADTLVGAFTRNFVISGIEQFQSGSLGSWTVSGTDTNGDGNAFNDRPILGNVGAPLNTAGIDGSFVHGTPGVYYDIAAVNQTGALNPVTANQVHFLVPDNSSGQYTNAEIGRNSFSNPGTTRNDIAVQKGFGTGLLHLERGQFLIRVEAQDFTNHNDRGPYLDTSVLDFGTPTSLTNQSLARSTSGPAGVGFGRQLVLWGKFQF